MKAFECQKRIMWHLKEFSEIKKNKNKKPAHSIWESNTKFTKSHSNVFHFITTLYLKIYGHKILTDLTSHVISFPIYGKIQCIEAIKFKGKKSMCIKFSFLLSLFAFLKSLINRHAFTVSDDVQSLAKWSRSFSPALANRDRQWSQVWKTHLVTYFPFYLCILLFDHL